MHYYANFRDIRMHPYQVDIYTPNGLTEQQITLADAPVIVTTESEGLFSPIKSQSCTINIMTNGMMFDLYTIDPQEIRVVVYRTDLATDNIVFRGYATPCQYGQDWTSIDVLSLECVECISSLKDIPYSYYGGYGGQHLSILQLICYTLAKIEHPNQDELYHSLTWYWPKKSYRRANGKTFTYSIDFLKAVKLNEANFFDDDDEKTPWSCYEVLEEICKFLNVTLVPYAGSYYFIDYLYSAYTDTAAYSNNRYLFWACSLDGDTTADDPSDQTLMNSGNKMRLVNIQKSDYVGGTTEIGTDDLYNKISIDANRYDIDELMPDLYEEAWHESLTKKYNFGGDYQTWTIQQTNFWGTTSVIKQSYAYKQYCILKDGTGWSHTYWSPRSMNEYYNNDPYSTTMQGYSLYTSIPENKYINTVSATILHYATLDTANTKPTKLDWKDVIMFNCLTDTIKPHSTMGKYLCSDILSLTPWCEKPVLQYNSSYELNFSPKQGKSWIVINGALWYQQYTHTENSNGTVSCDLLVTDPTKHTQIMFPIEDCTNATGYYAKIKSVVGSSTYQTSWFRGPSAANYGTGWGLMRFKLQIGDKYWNGSTWTTTESTFIMNFSASIKIGDAEETDTFTYLKWMNIITNTNYQDKVGTDGYAIPIAPADGVCGKVTLTLYTPRQVPSNHGITGGYATFYNNMELDWYERAPVVFMKDFKVEYVYTDETEWWLDQQDDKKDIKYSNDTSKDRYEYEKNIECKINSWQENRPIAKSFPIVDFTNNGTTTRQFLTKIGDESITIYQQEQEYNIIGRYLRHYETPEKTVKFHTDEIIKPWSKVTFANTAQISGTYVVDQQEFDVKNMNNTVTVVEFGDATEYDDDKEDGEEENN